MASHLHKAQDKVRKLVSKKKKRFVEDGFDLDLSYITPQIVAMGVPAEGMEAHFRNQLPEVARFFKTRHNGRYKIYNLCEKSKYHYDSKHFENRLAMYPFADHNCPALSLLQAISEDMHSHITAHPQNVAAIHCKAGKGRTGTVIASYLVYSRAYNATDALDFYGKQRTKDGRGVTIPSQRRYVYYFEEYLNQYLWKSRPFPNEIVKMLTKVVIHTSPSFDVGGGCDPFILTSTPDGLVTYNMKKDGPKIYNCKDVDRFEINISIPIHRDVRIQFSDLDKITQDDKMCWCWIHPAFIKDNYLRLERQEVDGACLDKKFEHFDANFALEFFFKDT